MLGQGHPLKQKHAHPPFFSPQLFPFFVSSLPASSSVAHEVPINKALGGPFLFFFSPFLVKMYRGSSSPS